MTAQRSSDAFIMDLKAENTSNINLAEKYKGQRDEANARASEWHPDHTIWYVVAGLVGTAIGIGLGRGVFR